MKSTKFILIILALTFMLSACGCQAPNPDTDYISAYDGKCSIIIKEDRGFYYPLVSGHVALEFRPDKLTMICAGHEFELDIKSVNYVDDVQVFGFKQEHIFGRLYAQDYSISIGAYYAGKRLEIKDFGTFVCDDEYSAIGVYDEATGETFTAMTRESEWIPSC